MNKIFSKIGLFVASLAVCMASCSDDLPTSKVEPYDTDLLKIKILNAGADGNTQVEGTVDEENKKITFPRLSVETDFSAIKVEAEVSEGAHLETDVYDFSMDEQTSEKTLLLRVQNHNRYKDYFFQIKKKVPVFGADFEKPVVYDFTAENKLPDYSSLSTRCADFDGKYVLVVSRKTSPYLLDVERLKEGSKEPVKLDMTGVSGGTFSYNGGALVNGHVYMASLAGAKASPLNIYYWETPTSKPQKLATFFGKDIEGTANRYGDQISVNINKEGNGFIYLADNSSETVLRLSVKNYTTVEKPVVLKSNPNTTAWSNVYHEPSGNLIWSGIRLPATLANGQLAPIYTMKNLPAETIAARIVYFNKERYLITCSAGLGGASKATPTLYVFDLTRGETLEDAMKEFDNGTNHHPVYEFTLGGSGNGAPGTQTNYFIEKDQDGNDSKLYLFASRADSGFVIVEFPIKVAED